MEEAVRAGAELVTDCRVTDLAVTGKEVTAVHAVCHGRKRTFHADFVILAAGGLGTPVILESSGISCEKTLFVDPVLCVAGPLQGLRQDRQILMPFISQQKGYILAPYMDYLSFFFNKDWRIPMRDMASIMIKLADEEIGGVSRKKIDKQMTAVDQSRMEEAVALTRKILVRMGNPPILTIMALAKKIAALL